MNARIFLTKIGCGLIIVFALIFSTWAGATDNNRECQWIPVDQNSFGEILIMIEGRVKENYSKIGSWQGKIKVVTDSTTEDSKRSKFFQEILDERPLPDKINQHQEFTREFALDVNKGLLYENCYPEGLNQLVDSESGRILQRKERVHPGSGKFILTPDYHLACMENKNRDGVIVSHTVIKQARPPGDLTCQSQLPPVFDPRDTMGIFGDVLRQSFDPLGGAFAKYLAFFDKEGGHNIDGYPTITVEECDVGDVKKYRVVLLSLAKDSTGATVHIFLNLVCSSGAGFNVVSYTTTDNNGRVFENKTWDYGLFNGVYLPEQTNKLLFDNNTGNLNEQSAVNFIDQKANIPIIDEVFTYKNLGLKNGDKFIDKILDKEYTYQDENLVEVEKKSK